MKTITEFTGIEIKFILKCQAELLKAEELQLEKNTDPLESSNSQADVQELAENKADPVSTAKNPEQEQAQDDVHQNLNETKHSDSKNLTEAQENNANIENANTEPSSKPAQTDASTALKPKNSSWKERVEAIRPHLIEELKKHFAWKNEDRYNLAIDASRIVNPRMQDTLRKVTAYKKDNDQERTPKFAQEIGELIFSADYIVIKKEKNNSPHSKDNANRKKHKPGFKDKSFKDNDKPAKKFKKPVPNPIKSNNKTVVVEKK